MTNLMIRERWFWKYVQGCNTTYWTHKMTKQDRHCSYDITLMCVSVTRVVVQKQYVLHNLGVC